MSARVWSAPALGASLAALPSPRASTAGESALAAAAWLLSGEESRFSTRRIFALARGGFGGASRLLGVWLARTASLVLALRRSGAMPELRSHRWFGVHDLRSFGHRSRTL